MNTIRSYVAKNGGSEWKWNTIDKTDSIPEPVIASVDSQTAINFIRHFSRQFSNGVVVVNVTPHSLTFLDGDDVVTVPPSGPEGSKTGLAVINAAPTEEPVPDDDSGLLVRTVFRPTEAGALLCDALLSAAITAYPESRNILLVGSLAAANAYIPVVGVCPAPGFERVPPAEKRMSISKFNVGDAF